MDLHPIPRQITTFEFKLIGFMTIKQFGFVLLAGVIGYLFFLAIPIQILNIIVGVLIFSVGLIFAFVPVNDRPLDVFLRNLVRRLNSPTQYIFRKQNAALHIFDELYFEADPHIVLAHADSKEKLSAYLTLKGKGAGQKDPSAPRHEHIGALLKEKQVLIPAPSGKVSRVDKPLPPSNQTPKIKEVKPVSTKHPVFTGMVFNKRHIPLPGVLLYLRDSKTNVVLRILKTNPHGVFATFAPLADGEYSVEIVDSSGGYLFDKASITISNQNRPSFEFVSKETL